MSSVGSMEKMYQKYKDIAEFRMIYIREAHAADSQRPNNLSKSLGIKEHTNLEERCSTAKRLIEDKSLSMPMLVDGMNNAANLAYSAQPDRVFLVRPDGVLAVAADRGPFGFAPGIKDVEKWLAEFKKTGEPPALSDEALFTGESASYAFQKSHSKALASKLKTIAGTWNVETDDMPKSEVVVLVTDDSASVTIMSEEAGTIEVDPANVWFDGKMLSFNFLLDQNVVRFDGEAKGNSVTGTVKMGANNNASQWSKK